MPKELDSFWCKSSPQGDRHDDPTICHVEGCHRYADIHLCAEHYLSTTSQLQDQARARLVADLTLVLANIETIQTALPSQLLAEAARTLTSVLVRLKYNAGHEPRAVADSVRADAETTKGDSHGTVD